MVLIYWIVVGLIAGWLAGKLMRGGGYGILVDTILGMVGGIVGGWVFGIVGIWPAEGIIGAIIVAFMGAVILLWISRVLKRACLHPTPEKSFSEAANWAENSLSEKRLLGT